MTLTPERPKPFFLQNHNKNLDTVSTCSDFVLEDSIDGKGYWPSPYLVLVLALYNFITTVIIH